MRSSKFSENSAKFVHAHSRKPHPNILRELCRSTATHKFCTISAHVWMPLHIFIFCANFLGPVRNALRTSFAQFSRENGLFSEAAAVQATNVSRLDQNTQLLHVKPNSQNKKFEVRVTSVEMVGGLINRGFCQTTCRKTFQVRQISYKRHQTDPSARQNTREGRAFFGVFFRKPSL